MVVKLGVRGHGQVAAREAAGVRYNCDAGDWERLRWSFFGLRSRPAKRGIAVELPLPPV